MKVFVVCLVILSIAVAVMAFPSHEERTKRSPHRSKLRVKVVQRGPLGLRKHKYRYKGLGLGHYAGGYGYGGYGGYGRPAIGGSSSFSSSFSSPFGSFATAGATAGR